MRLLFNYKRGRSLKVGDVLYRRHLQKLLVEKDVGNQLQVQNVFLIKISIQQTIKKLIRVHEVCLVQKFHRMNQVLSLNFIVFKISRFTLNSCITKTFVRTKITHIIYLQMERRGPHHITIPIAVYEITCGRTWLHSHLWHSRQSQASIMRARTWLLGYRDTWSVYSQIALSIITLFCVPSHFYSFLSPASIIMLWNNSHVRTMRSILFSFQNSRLLVNVGQSLNDIA